MSPVNQVLIVNLLVWTGVLVLLLLAHGGAARLEENPKAKALPGIVAAVVIGLFAVVFHRENLVPFADFDTARETGKFVKIVGYPVKNSAAYDAKAHLLRFRVMDENDVSLTAEYPLPRPTKFDRAAGIALTGIYKNGVFRAKKLDEKPFQIPLIVNLAAWAGIFFLLLALDGRVRRLEKS